MQATDYKQVWLEAYQTLNPQQRQAVDLIDGPVIALAGPGTGKTQLLAVRIGKILQQPDIHASNILALTFTDAGAHAMRHRLKRFIGTEAHNVTICTFHAFCMQVINENIEHFGAYRDLQTLSDLEAVDVLCEVIDSFPDDHILRHLKGDPYIDSPRIKNLFNTMKREGWTHQDMEQAVLDLEARLQDHPSFIAKRKTTTKTGEIFLSGDTRTDKIALEINKFDKLLAASPYLDRYNAILKRLERFDYSDMIQWVIEAFEREPELLADYQERYQYILVDEYQDTNGSQNDLVFKLASYWDRPNLFVVGDDDQSIYRFQGADMDNIAKFIDTYNPGVVVLENNYRSTDGILAAAAELIQHNQGRIAKRYKIAKNLVASRPSPQGPPPAIQVYTNKTQEQVGIIENIKALHSDGVPYHEMAVLYTRHRLAEDMIRYLQQSGLPVSVKKKVDALKEIDVRRLIDILDYLHLEYLGNNRAEHLLFEIMHFDFFELSARDIGRISLYCQRSIVDEDKTQLEGRRNWRDVLASEEDLKAAGVSAVADFLRFSDQIERWINNINNYTLQVFFEKVMTEGGLLDEILRSGDQAWRLQVVNTFFNFIKNESAKTPDLNLGDLLAMIQKMTDNRISLDLMNVTHKEHGIQFMTIHGSKGLEFEHVFLMDATEKNWEKKRSSHLLSFTYPQQKYVNGMKEMDEEEQRRLFFVALTRAKNRAYISFASSDNDDKPLTASKFVAEINPNEETYDYRQVDDTAVLAYSAELLRYQEAMPTLIDNDLIEAVLVDFRMSPTSLNKYLRCPIAFYYENILRVPSARDANTGYGNAMHFALERYFIEAKAADMTLPDLDTLLAYFKNGMDRFASHFTKKEMQSLSQHGRQILSDYYESNHTAWQDLTDVATEYKIDQFAYHDVPITGLLDKVEIRDNKVTVLDYKTGNPESTGNRKKLKPPMGDEDPGGDYWRQIIFYRLLVDADPRQNWDMISGIMDFLIPKKDGTYVKQEYYIEPFELELVGKQVVETYEKIVNHEFDHGCREETCKWCKFVAENTEEAKVNTT